MWRSIFNTKIVVRQGTRLRIGLGYNILITGEPWLGTSTRIPLIGPNALALHSYSVVYLIDQSTKNWNEQLVQYIFEEETTQQVMNTPPFHQVN